MPRFQPYHVKEEEEQRYAKGRPVRIGPEVCPNHLAVPDLCAHKCYRCGVYAEYGRDGFMYPNVRCPECGHAWMNFNLKYTGVLDTCNDCNVVIDTCDYCMYRRGVKDPCTRARKWCSDCWVVYFEQRFLKNYPCKVVSLHVVRTGEQKGMLDIACSTLDGNEILKQTWLNASLAIVGDLRPKLKDALNLEELRLLPDRAFYSKGQVAEWASCFDEGILPLERRRRNGCFGGCDNHPSLDTADKCEAYWENVWDTSPKLQLGQFRLVTSDGQCLSPDDDRQLLNQFVPQNLREETSGGR